MVKKDYSIEIDNRKIYPMGVTTVEGGIHISFVSRASRCALLLYKRGSHAPAARVEFPAASRTGDVWSMTVLGKFGDLEYTLEEDGTETPDPYGLRFTGREHWGGENGGRPRAVRTLLPGKEEAFDWQDDAAPCIPYEDSIIYHIHTRGFTKHRSSQVEARMRGTFGAVAQKIPYMKELGVTTVELMPPVEFEEIIWPEREQGAFSELIREADTAGEGTKLRINYWGYGPALRFAPKAACSCGPACDAQREFKEMVKALHREGMELIIELYFDGTEPPVYVLEVVRFWAREYHVDGIHIVGDAPLKLLAEDPYLSRLKLIASQWTDVDCGQVRHLAECNDGFMLDMRGFLKGDEGMLNSVAFHTRHNPGAKAAINYMAGTNGFTMMDMVSYNKKHNEDNDENNRDGTDYNQSWNCGVEGPTRKKRILGMRRKQLRNAFLLLLLSQGTPLIVAGDEFGRTKKGNNNSYCQDNDISWLNWGLLKTNKDIYEFAKQAIAFRKAHPIFHMEKEPALLDYDSVGMPDVSYHGLKAWYPEFDNSRRQLGIFYCGKYGKKPDGSVEDYFYVAYNMHWEPQEFALPNLPRTMKWQLVFDTDDEAANGFYPEGSQEPLEKQKTITVMARSIVVLVGKEEKLAAKEKKPYVK